MKFGKIEDYSGNLRTVYSSGSFTHDLSSTETQSITGLGFKPSKLILMACVDSALFQLSMGMDNGTIHSALFDRGAAVDNTWGITASSYSIFINVGSGVFSSAYVSSFDNDGFTLTWGKTGSPTGTVTVFYLAI